MKKVELPRVFIASASKSKSIADALNQNIGQKTEVTVWPDAFAPSSTTLSALFEQVQSSDFAVFVFSSDDTVVMRDQEEKVPRDNVVFEAGLFAGKLGIERCFIVTPGDEDVQLPSDLLGLSVVKYQANRSDNSLKSAMRAPSSDILDRIAKLGRIQNTQPPPVTGDNKAVGYFEVREIDVLTLSCINLKAIADDNGLDGADTNSVVYGSGLPGNLHEVSVSIVRLVDAELVEISHEVDMNGNIYAKVATLTKKGRRYLAENADEYIKNMPVPPQKKETPQGSEDFDDDIPF